jgi:hypothetical protein
MTPTSWQVTRNGLWIRQAFAMWAAQASLTFTEVGDQSQANILIGWATAGMFAHSSFPNPDDDRQVFLQLTFSR